MLETFETEFNDILVSESNPTTQLCANKREARPTLSGILNKAQDVRYSHRLRFAYLTFHVCRAIMIRNCGNPACIATMDDLKLVIPPCATWPGLQQWALQFAACLCSGQAGNLENDFLAVFAMMMYFSTFASSKSSQDAYAGRSGIFINWAQQIDPWEAIPLISWVWSISMWGDYQDLSMYMWRMDSMMLTDGYRDRAIAQAISRAHKLRLCPHRVWAIAFTMYGQESNIPALVPDNHSLCSYKHDYCSSGLSHKNCTYDYCEISAVNFTNVVQCHRPGCDGKCQKKVFPVHLLDKAASESRPTAWAIDGELCPLEAGERYMTISHVWSDGTGGSGSVNKCMFDLFCDVARKLECKGLWWDAICIPQDKHARAKAISQMHEYYSQAACTIVHDACLAMSEWVDSEHASFALVMSNWFTRGWTALELSRSKRVKVLFSARGNTGYVLKNLDVDIVARRAIVCSMSRQAASKAIHSLRKNLHSKEPYTLDDVLAALGSRFTSWARDRAVIAGQLVGIENLANDQYGIYQQVVCKIGKISLNQLFHHAASPTGPFAWLPSSLFDLPVSQGPAEIEVLRDGSLRCKLCIILLPVNFQFSWDSMHPMSRCRVREVVKVMKDTAAPYILCRYVGPLRFAPLPVDPKAYDSSRQRYSVLISDSGADLGKMPGWGSCARHCICIWHMRDSLSSSEDNVLSRAVESDLRETANYVS